MALAAIGLPCRLLAANLRSATPPVARTRSTPARQPPQRSLLLPGLASRRDQIPIAPAALAARSPHHRIDPTRGSLPWRFSYAGPRCMWHRRHGAGIRKPSQLRTLVDAAGGSGMCQLRTHAPQQAASVRVLPYDRVKSHSLIPSRPPESALRPSGAKATQRTDPQCPLRLRTACPSPPPTVSQFRRG